MAEEAEEEKEGGLGVAGGEEGGLEGGGYVWEEKTKGCWWEVGEAEDEEEEEWRDAVDERVRGCVEGWFWWWMGGNDRFVNF